MACAKTPCRERGVCRVHARRTAQGPPLFRQMRITGTYRAAAKLGAAWESPSLAAPSPKYDHAGDAGVALEFHAVPDTRGVRKQRAERGGDGVIVELAGAVVVSSLLQVQ